MPPPTNPEPVDADAQLNRRSFLRLGLASTVILSGFSGAALLTGCGRHDQPAAGYRFLRNEEIRVFSAVAPVILEGVWPTAANSQTLNTFLVAVDTSLYHSSPDGHKQLHELFDLLCFAPSRWLLLGLASPWEKASQAEINAMLEHCSQGRLDMQRAIANALCRITKMTWYLQPDSWEALGYVAHRPVIDAPVDTGGAI